MAASPVLALLVCYLQDFYKLFTNCNKFEINKIMNSEKILPHCRHSLHQSAFIHRCFLTQERNFRHLKTSFRFVKPGFAIFFFERLSCLGFALQISKFTRLCKRSNVNICCVFCGLRCLSRLLLMPFSFENLKKVRF